MASLEEKVEDYYKGYLRDNKIKYFNKTDDINPRIDDALKTAPSKRGGSGGNKPDIRAMINGSGSRDIPVMMEAKGGKNKMIKLDDNGNIALVSVYTKDGKDYKAGDPDYSTIKNYAVNGAVHYGKAILSFTGGYEEVVVVGLNGTGTTSEGELDPATAEVQVYYMSKKNDGIPKLIEGVSDLSFLKKANIPEFIKKCDDIILSPEDRAKERLRIEGDLDKKLKTLNQIMQDILQVNVNYRVNMVSSMIMAGLPVEGLAPIDLSDLKGNVGANHDGEILNNRISAFLSKKSLPAEKKEMIMGMLRPIYIDTPSLFTPVNGETPLKSIYRLIVDNIIPVFENPSSHMDFTGKLFNVLNEWVKVPDGAENDVVLTPRYVTDFMAKITRVNRNSYVWDYATGSAGFLVSAMQQMVADATENISDVDERNNAIRKIKCEQILGIEKLGDIYMLAVLNMILMGDGSSNILHEDSLRDFSGNYEQGNLKDEPFPADVFLLNPPYSGSTYGLDFVEKATARMKKGYAAVLIQDNAGSGTRSDAQECAKRILKKNTLVASIKMPNDLFCGKSSVQTAIYLFKVGEAHDKDKDVLFFDLSDDGYLRTSRRKATTNLKNIDHATERYAEVTSKILGKSDKTIETAFYTIDNGLMVKDVISLEGNDWNYIQHMKTNLTPTETDFINTVSDYLSWRISRAIKGA